VSNPVNRLEKDPINLIITGVGGQGNVLISRLIGEALLEDGYQVTIGETYGVSQRGGAVASHVRISKVTQYSFLTPEGKGDVILGLEAMETLRILGMFGSSKTFVITNTRPIHPMCVSTGEAEYPPLEAIKQGINELSQKAWYIDGSEIAMGLGTPLLTNMVMAGVLMSTGLLPLKRKIFERCLEASFWGEKLSLNLQALERGLRAMGRDM
jgi:indolepyruvate ferredoxin oxidoreductase beta subunit